MSKTKHALSLIADSAFAVAKSETEVLQNTTAEQLAGVAALEGQAAMGATLAGINLHRVKASTKHGEFGKWLDQICTTSANLGVKPRQANYYMRLAAVFLEKSRLSKSELLTGLDGAEETARAPLVSALKKFVGEHSLNELLIKNDIKSVGLKSALALEEAPDGEESPEAKLARSRASAWEESYAAVQRIRAALTEPAQLQLLTDPAQIETIKNEAVEITQLAEARLKALRSAIANVSTPALRE